MKASPRGVVFVVLLVVTAMVGSFVYVAPAVLVFLLESILLDKSRSTPFRRVSHWWCNWVQGSWFHFVDLLLEVLLGIRVRCTVAASDGAAPLPLEALLTPPPPGKFNILISNHRTRIDWMLLWMLLHRTKSLSTLKIVLKEDLGRIPFFGWTMQTFRFLFLSRKWESDQQHMQRVLSYMKRHDDRATFLIFPEGSDLSEKNLGISTKYAQDNGLPVYRHILNPRTTGLVAMKNMIGADKIHAIYDVTMGFTDHPRAGRPSELCLLSGEVPRCVHFLCTAYRFRDVPHSDDGFRKWIEQRFQEKELLLSSFYHSSPVEFTEPSIRAVYGEQTTCLLAGPSKRLTLWTYSRKWLVATALMWMLPTVLFLAWVWRCEATTVVWITIVSLFFVATSKWGKGFNKCVLFRH